jgi:hypothetical protein
LARQEEVIHHQDSGRHGEQAESQEVDDACRFRDGFGPERPVPEDELRDGCREGQQPTGNGKRGQRHHQEIRRDQTLEACLIPRDDHPLQFRKQNFVDRQDDQAWKGGDHDRTEAERGHGPFAEHRSKQTIDDGVGLRRAGDQYRVAELAEHDSEVRRAGGDGMRPRTPHLFDRGEHSEELQGGAGEDARGHPRHAPACTEQHDSGDRGARNPEHAHGREQIMMDGVQQAVEGGVQIEEHDADAQRPRQGDRQASPLFGKAGRQGSHDRFGERHVDQGRNDRSPPRQA